MYQLPLQQVVLAESRPERLRTMTRKWGSGLRFLRFGSAKDILIQLG